MVDMDEVRWLDEAEARAWRGLRLMELRLNGALARQLATGAGLSHPDYVVLVALTDQPDGRLRLFELGRILGWEKSRLSHQISRMADRGLVTKEKCDADRRGAYVVISAKGRREIEAAAPGHVALVRQLFVDVLTPAQLATIAEVAETVLARLDATCPDEEPPPTLPSAEEVVGADAPS